MSRFTPTTHQTLIDAGWHPGRKIDIDAYATFIQAEEGFVLDVAKDFLSEFGGLEIFKGTSQYIYLDPTKAHDGWYFGLASRYMGEEINMVGSIAARYMTLLVSKDGRFFAIFEEALIWIGDSIDETMENLCHNRSKKIDPPPRKKT